MSEKTGTSGEQREGSGTAHGTGAAQYVREGFPAERLVLRVDFEDGGFALDDLAIGGDLIHMLRLERMSGDSVWGKVYLRDGRSLRLSLHIEKRSLKMNAEWE